MEPATKQYTCICYLPGGDIEVIRATEECLTNLVAHGDYALMTVSSGINPDPETVHRIPHQVSSAYYQSCRRQEAFMASLRAILKEHALQFEGPARPEH